MKELTIEEKAKRYDEALERAKEKYAMFEGMKQGDVLEDVFPELKESEDERIRKELIEFVKSRGGFKQEYIAWLEKQDKHANFLSKIQVGDKVTRNEDGELVNLSQLNRVAKKDENQCQTFTKKDVDNAYLKGVADTKNEIEKQYDATYQIRKDIATFIFNYKGDIKDRAKWMDYLGIKVSFVGGQSEQKETLCDKCRKEHPSHSCQDITALGRCAVEYKQKSAETVKWSSQEESCICQLESLVKEQWRQAERVHNSVNIKKMSELMFFLKTLNPNKKPADKVKPFDEYEGLTDFERTLADICIGWIGQEPGWKQYIKDNADILLKIAIKKFNSIQDAPFE